VVLRADGGPDVPVGASLLLRGAETVASRALAFSRMDLIQRPALINGAAGAVSMKDGKPFSIAAVTVRDGRIVELDFVSDPAILARLDLTVLEPS
jgi:RNA polymerase sigma-70 factor (ECF subfamily)